MTRVPRERQFGAVEAARFLLAPRDHDDKYSRGVVGFVTGSALYPGAAVLGTSAALRTGVGYVRFVGNDQVAEDVLHAHPEVVCGVGRADAWVAGSGIDAVGRSAADTNRLLTALTSGAPVVLDAGALDLHSRATGPAVLTPHARELARLLAQFGHVVDAESFAAHPAKWAAAAADLTGHCVLLKGHQSVIAVPHGEVLLPPQGSAWLSTAGTGDVLAGALGALLATVWVRRDEFSEGGQAGAGGEHELLAHCAATAVTLHSRASHSVPAPMTASELAEALRDARAEVLREDPGMLS